MTNKRKREEDDDLFFPKKDLSKELRILGREFNIRDGKYYIGDKLINDIIEENKLDTLSLNFAMDDEDSKFIKQISPQIKKIRLVRYNNPIDELPDSITHIETGVLDYPINKLPKSLTHLWVDVNFSSTIKHFPENLVFLKLSKRAKFNPHQLPGKLRYLEIAKADCVDNLPNSITHLKITCDVSVEDLPESVTHLELGNGCEYGNTDMFNSSVDNLPSNLISLNLGSKFNKPINNLPRKLQELKIGNMFNQSIDNLPSTLESLHVGACFNQPVNNLPINLKKLTLGMNFNKPIDNLNPNLRTLELGSNFNQLITKLPDSLQTIKFNSYYTQPLDNLHSKLKNIEINIRDYILNLQLVPRNDLITIYYKTSLKMVDFRNLHHLFNIFKFNLKVGEQVHLIELDKTIPYQNIFDYDTKQKLHVKIEFKKANDNFIVDFKLK